MSESVLITGITGFVGQNLSNYLHANGNFQQTGVSRRKKLSDKFVTYSELFVRDKSYRSYVHLAGKAHDTDYSTSRETFFEANLHLTKKLYDLFLSDSKARAFIHISSIAAVDSSSNTPMDEEVNPKPNGFYGESKGEAEKYLLTNLPNEEQKKVIIIRPPMIHGPGNKGNLNLLYSIVSKGIPWPLGSFNNSRSFLSIENLCFVIKEALEGKLNTGVYHVSDDTPHSTNELICIISGVRNRKPRIWSVPKPIINLTAKIGNVLPLPLNEERLEKLTENYLVSNKKIKKSLGIEQMPVSARDGMFRTIDSFEQ